MPWQRPSSAAFPSVWSHHTGTRALPSGHIPQFRIQDATPEMFQEVVDHMCTYFVADEPLCSNSSMLADPVSLAEIRGLWTEAVKDHMTLVALEEMEDGTTRLAGVNMTCMSLAQDKDKKHVYAGVSMKKVLSVVEHLTDVVNVFDKYNVTEYLTAYGLSVAPAYRGQGLGLAILRARTPLCRATGVRLTATVFTADNSQELARRAGFEFVAQLSYKDYKDGEGNEVFPGLKPKLCITMALRTV